MPEITTNFEITCDECGDDLDYNQNSHGDFEVSLCGCYEKDIDNLKDEIQELKDKIEELKMEAKQ